MSFPSFADLKMCCLVVGCALCVCVVIENFKNNLVMSLLSYVCSEVFDCIVYGFVFVNCCCVLCVVVVCLFCIVLIKVCLFLCCCVLRVWCLLLLCFVACVVCVYVCLTCVCILCMHVFVVWFAVVI